MPADRNNGMVLCDLLRRSMPIVVLVLISTTPLSACTSDVELGLTGRDPSVPSCTIFSIALGDTMYFGNNEDYRHEPDELFISFVPPQELPESIHLPLSAGTMSIYGHVLVGDIMMIDGEEVFWPQGGMNDQGLCVDVNSVPLEDLNATQGTLWRPWMSNNDLLWVCSTVDEVIEWYQSHRLPTECLHGWNGQLHYTDVSGDSVVVVPNNGGFTFTERGNDSYLVSTNFNRANVYSNLDGYPCWRYNTAIDMLSDITSEDELTVEACRDILDAVHIDRSIFSTLETLYSTVYDPVNGAVYLYFLHDYSSVKVFSLEEEFAKVDLESANFTLQENLVEKTYLMQEFFPGYQSSTPNYVTHGLVIGGVLLSVAVLVIVRNKVRGRKGV